MPDQRRYVRRTHGEHFIIGAWNSGGQLLRRLSGDLDGVQVTGDGDDDFDVVASER